MSVDLYLYSVPTLEEHKVTDQTFNHLDVLDIHEISYWRNDRDLVSYIKDMYVAKGGTGDFNGDTVYLNHRELVTLLKLVVNKKLPHTFIDPTYHDPHDPEVDTHTVIALCRAIVDLAEGRDVYFEAIA